MKLNPKTNYGPEDKDELLNEIKAAISDSDRNYFDWEAPDCVDVETRANGDLIAFVRGDSATSGMGSGGCSVTLDICPKGFLRLTMNHIDGWEALEAEGTLTVSESLLQDIQNTVEELVEKAGVYPRGAIDSDDELIELYEQATGDTVSEHFSAYDDNPMDREACELFGLDYDDTEDREELLGDIEDIVNHCKKTDIAWTLPDFIRTATRKDGRLIACIEEHPDFGKISFSPISVTIEKDGDTVRAQGFPGDEWTLLEAPYDNGIDPDDIRDEFTELMDGSGILSAYCDEDSDLVEICESLDNPPITECFLEDDPDAMDDEARELFGIEDEEEEEEDNE